MDAAADKKGAHEAPEEKTDSEEKLYYPLRWRSEPDPLKGWHELGREAREREKKQRPRRQKGGGK